MKLLVIINVGATVVGSVLTPMFEVEQVAPDVGCNLMRLVVGYFSSFFRG
jgi:hypothetical protein